MAEGSGNGNKLRIEPATAFQVIAWIVAALVTYGAINARVSVVESQMDTFRSDLSEMKRDIKELLRRP